MSNQLSPEQIREAEPFFWPRVDVKGEDECWPWLKGQTGRVGEEYGKFSWHSEPYKAHQFALATKLGHWPQKPTLHSCDFGLCCNPKHVSEGSLRKNSLQASQRGRLQAAAAIRWREYRDR